MASLSAGYQVILTPNGSGLEPIRKSHFVVEMQDGDGGTPGQDLNFLVKSFSPPAKSVDVKTVRFVNHDKTFPAQRSAIEGSQVVLRCLARDASSQAHQFLQKWFDSIYNAKSDSVILIGEDYKGRVVLKPVNLDGSPFVTCTLQGAWPSSIKLDDGDAEDDGSPINFTTTFQCQDVIYQFA